MVQANVNRKIIWFSIKRSDTLLLHSPYPLLHKIGSKHFSLFCRSLATLYNAERRSPNNQSVSIKDSSSYTVTWFEKEYFLFCIVNLVFILPKQAIPIHLAIRQLLKSAQPKASPRPKASWKQWQKHIYWVKNCIDLSALTLGALQPDRYCLPLVEGMQHL